MKKYIAIIAFLVSIFSSCRNIYDPDIDSDQRALVVEGLITDQPGTYTVKLSTAVPFDSSGTTPPVISAKVSIFDDCGNTYKLSESISGSYVSNPAEFIGIPGRSYTLHIETQDGNIYESTPQLLLPGNYNENAYGEAVSKDVLLEDAYGVVSKITVQGFNLLYDLYSSSDTSLRFRFQPVITTEYNYSYKKSPMLTYNYYCWYTSAVNDLVNLTQEKYQTSSKDIKKHEVCFVPKEYTLLVSCITDSAKKKDTLLNASIINRIVKVYQYRVNDETYQFYKNINTLLAAQGKLFDPVAFQFKGNVHCTNNSQKLVLGIFEASSLRINSYANRPGSKNFTKIQDFNPVPPSGCVGVSSQGPSTNGNPPAFWVY
jgi:hypothetical protein